jgi:hypothetical protein
VTSPDLVAVSPGVQVIADADEPLFYADGYYWLYRDNTWMRSDNYRGGFARIDVNIVPQGVRAIQQPQTYAHYRRNTGRAYARGGQVQQRQPMRPQGTQQYPQPQPQQQRPMQQPTERHDETRPEVQRPMDQRPIDQRPLENNLPPRPVEPGTTPTEPTPSSPYQKTPVPNPIPGHEGTRDDDHRDMKPRDDKNDKERDYDK